MLFPDDGQKCPPFLFAKFCANQSGLGSRAKMKTANLLCFSFWMPLVCFVLIALYGFSLSKLSRAEGIKGMQADGGH